MAPHPRLQVLLIFAFVLLLGGCGHNGLSAAQLAKQRAAIKRANEAGELPVLVYHRVGGDLTFAPDFTISAGQLRRELEYLLHHDYYPVNFRDLVRGRLDVPAGKTPVVLTFDDSSDSQFTFVRRHGKLVPDPGGAVGVLLDFHARHPSWPLRGTFFALPGANAPNNLFGQPRLAARKLHFLLDHGFELGLHTLWHANLATVSETEVVRQLALDVAALKHFTGRRDFTSLAVPYGVYPKNEALLRAGRFGKESYRVEGVAEFAYTGARARPPWARGFDPIHIPRIPTGTDPGESRPALLDLERHPRTRYISDGDPSKVTVPRAAAGTIDQAAVRRAGSRVRLRP
jgi:peptidoglycan/xylan/chitin deacetylase (PgdA/CDA1 family)